jgi:hypothetical protein
MSTSHCCEFVQYVAYMNNRPSIQLLEYRSHRVSTRYEPAWSFGRYRVRDPISPAIRQLEDACSHSDTDRLALLGCRTT